MERMGKMEFMLKKTALATLFFAVAVVATAQGDNGAGEKIMNRLAKTISSYKCLYFEYTLRTEDIHAETSSLQDGKVLTKGKKFKALTKDVEIYNDGVNQWYYMKADNEVTVSLSDTSDVVLNPLLFITGDRKNFKQRLKGAVNEDGFTLTEVNFYPSDLRMPYAYIRLHLDEQKQEPYSLRYVGKDGVNYTIKIKSYAPNIELPDDAEFAFNAAAHPGITEVDLRDEL
jgi:hypothetical protein